MIRWIRESGGVQIVIVQPKQHQRHVTCIRRRRFGPVRVTLTSGWRHVIPYLQPTRDQSRPDPVDPVVTRLVPAIFQRSFRWISSQIDGYFNSTYFGPFQTVFLINLYPDRPPPSFRSRWVYFQAPMQTFSLTSKSSKLPWRTKLQAWLQRLLARQKKSKLADSPRFHVAGT